jgi:hypothetical protein
VTTLPSLRCGITFGVNCESDDTATQIINQIVDDMTRLHHMALRDEDLTEEANVLRRNIQRRWSSLDRENCLRMQRAQQDLLKKLWSIPPRDSAERA